MIANGKGKNYLTTISTADKADVLAQYNEYITYGAFPELVEIKNKRTFLSSIYQTVYLGDIITRNKITNDFAIKLILKKIAESITKPLSFSRLTKHETRAFVKLRNFIPESRCLIITGSEEASLECDGIPISVVPAWKWLLDTPENN